MPRKGKTPSSVSSFFGSRGIYREGVNVGLQRPKTKQTKKLKQNKKTYKAEGFVYKKDMHKEMRAYCSRPFCS